MTTTTTKAIEELRSIPGIDGEFGEEDGKIYYTYFTEKLYFRTDDIWKTFIRDMRTIRKKFPDIAYAELREDESTIGVTIIHL
jgi:hypothetical protein